MATEIKMPQLSDTMNAGKILSWNKKEGDKIVRGDVLAEVETEKANMEIEAFHEGYLLKILTPAGNTAQVGDAIAFVGAQGEAVTGSSSNGASTNGTSANGSAPAAKPAPVEHETAPAVAAAPVSSPASQAVQQTSSSSDRIKVSPLAKKIADQKNVDLKVVRGSGPNGRIVKKDIESAASGSAPLRSAEPHSTPTAATPSARPAVSSGNTAPQASGELTGTYEELSKMRATIAKRMQQAVAEAPHFYVSTSIDMSEAVKLRKVLKESPELKDISINHLIIKAAAYALKNEASVNASMKGEQVFHPAQINIGIVTAIEGGLMIPVVKSVDTLSLKDIAFESRAGIERARAGRPNSSDLSGGTFSISNMGMFDVENFTAIISPGQGAILAVSSTLDQVVARNGQMVIVPIMKVTLSVDHRIIDGTMAGRWLTFFKQALEQPALMLI